MADYRPQLLISDHLAASLAGLSASNTQLTLAYCLTHPKWKLSLQTHKYLQIGEDFALNCRNAFANKLILAVCHMKDAKRCADKGASLNTRTRPCSI